ncbi:MAG: hypothetical protein HY929_06290 [Euryarchaeota archaeon]|nr:hypothetical protein [Euryarchaeota archaeon]
MGKCKTLGSKKREMDASVQTLSEILDKIIYCIKNEFARLSTLIVLVGILKWL